jgi:hypothetical protein
MIIDIHTPKDVARRTDYNLQTSSLFSQEKNKQEV